MIKCRTTSRLMMFCVAGALLAGCSRSPRVTFYTLNAAATPDASIPAGPFPSIAVGPVTLPEAADQPQLALRVAANRVEILETRRWAAPLKSEIPRIIAENLAIMLKESRVTVYPHNTGLEADYRVQLDLMRFEAVQDVGVTVDALWSLSRTGGVAVTPGHSLINEPATGDGYDSLVAAYGRALAALSRDIAKALPGAK